MEEVHIQADLCLGVCSQLWDDGKVLTSRLVGWQRLWGGMVSCVIQGPR